MSPKVTIIIPNYKTLELTKLCLRLIRKNTSLDLVQVFVVDNDSADESLEYLKSVKWIRLFERKAVPGEKSYINVSRGMDLALEQVNTPYVLALHTDSFVKDPQWLEFLLSHIENQPNVGGVGSWKLEYKPWHKRVMKWVETRIQSLYYDLIGKEDHALEGKGKNFLYLRSHCALYRTEFMRRYNVTFASGDGIPGKEMHRLFVEKGHKMVFIPSNTLIHYLDHVHHATQVLNPSCGISKRAERNGLKRIKRSLDACNADVILKDAALDQ